MRTRREQAGLPIVAANIARQAEDMARRDKRGASGRSKTGEIEGQPAGQQFQPALALAALAADAGKRGEARLGKQGLNPRSGRARASREKQRQAALCASVVKIARTGYWTFPPLTFFVVNCLALLGGARRVPSKARLPQIGAICLRTGQYAALRRKPCRVRGSAPRRRTTSAWVPGSPRESAPPD